MNVSSQLGFSAQVMVIGMLIVFIGLFILIICVKLMSLLLSAKKETKVEQSAPVANVPASAPAVQVQSSVENEDELIAVITAALMAYTGSGKTLVVRSIRRASGKTPAWAQAGRREQIESRF